MKGRTAQRTEHMDEERAGTLDVKFVVEQDMVIFNNTNKQEQHKNEVQELEARVEYLEQKVNELIGNWN